MKNYAKLLIVCLAISILTMPQQAKAQGETPKNVIKTNLTSLALASFSLVYERAITPKGSLLLSTTYTNLSFGASSGSSGGETKLNGLILSPEFRFYPSSKKSAPKGFYLAPFLSYWNLNLSTTTNSNGTTADAKATFNAFGGGFLLGYQWLIGNAFSIDLFVGPGFVSGSVNVDASSSATEDDFSIGAIASGTIPRAGLSIGIAF